jgi:hypothetical protein
MVNKAKQKGTAAETAIVNTLIAEGWVHAERRALSGAADKGDVKLGDGIPVMIEAKNCGTITIPAWLREVTVEKANAKADIGVAWFKLRGSTDPRKWAVLMTGEQFMDMLRDLGHHPDGPK